MTEFAVFARNLERNGKSEAQSFLEHFFPALGHSDVIEVGATIEFASPRNRLGAARACDRKKRRADSRERREQSADLLRCGGETGMVMPAWDDMNLADYLSVSRQALIFTGAGISTDSGIPDFRGPQGVWKRRQPVYYQDFMRSEAARIEHWDYKLEGREAFRDARPNAVHHAMVLLERAGRLRAVVTQNIDGLHILAGTTAERLVELHGTNASVECQSCQWRGDPEPHFESFRRTRRTPLCDCGGFLKPATISFGQSLDAGELDRARHAAVEADLVVALGSTLSVQPAASFPLLAARRGVPYIIINRGATDHDHEACVTMRIEGEVGEIFPAAVDAALGKGIAAPGAGKFMAAGVALL